MLATSFTSRDLSLLIPLLLVLLLAALQRGTAGVTPLELGILVAIPTIAAWAIFVWLSVSRTSRVNIPKATSWLVIFGVWSVASVFPAVYNGVEIITWGRRLFPPVALVVVTSVTVFTLRTREHVALLYSILVGVEIVLALSALPGLLSVELSSIDNLQYVREFGRGQHAGVLLALLLPLAAGYRYLSRLQQAVVVVGLFAGGASLLVSFSRTMWISTAAAAAFTAVVYLYHNRMTVQTALIGAGIGLGGCLVMFIGLPDKLYIFFFERLSSIPSALQSSSLQDRLFELRGLLSDAFRNPLSLLVGNGWGAEFTFYSVNEYSWDGIGWTSNAYSHNYYAYLLWSIGLIGLVCFIRYWQIIFRDGTRTLVDERLDGDRIYLLGCVAATISMLVSSLTGPLLTDTKWCVIYGFIGGIAIHILYDRSYTEG